MTRCNKLLSVVVMFLVLGIAACANNNPKQSNGNADKIAPTTTIKINNEPNQIVSTEENNASKTATNVGKKLSKLGSKLRDKSIKVKDNIVCNNPDNSVDDQDKK